MASENKTDASLVIFEQIETKIHKARGHRVMLDSDLAEVYGVETRILNQAVKRNLRRFPELFMFQLTEEAQDLRNSSQFVMSSQKHRGAKYRSYAFTEHGAVMLATVLKSTTAIEASLSGCAGIRPAAHDFTGTSGFGTEN